MEPVSRPALRSAFFLPKRLKVYFYTSNDVKFMHARAVCNRFGLELLHFRSRQAPYEEDYSIGRGELLRRAVEQVLQNIGSGALFFVEDTSVRIEALSDDVDVPGLRVKEWFGDTSFEELDSVLRACDDERRASVSSDIAVYIPALDRVVRVRGTTEGSVAETPPSFAASPTHPWLTPASFNGWFVPKGADRVLGEMSFEESWGYDFRVRSLGALVDRLEEYACIVNLPASGFQRAASRARPQQLTLLQMESRILLVVGYTCAGKTTFGEKAAGRRDCVFWEASSILRMLAAKEGLRAQGGFELARRVLGSLGGDIVARRAADLVAASGAEQIVITGFRAPEEVLFLKSQFDAVELLFIDSSERTRYQRYLQRGRDTTVGNIEAFRSRDEDQERFGLLPVVRDLAEMRLENEGTSIASLNEYLEKVDAIVGGVRDGVPGLSAELRPRFPVARERLYRCLDALRREGRPLTSSEIEVATQKAGWTVEARNANQALKAFSGLVRRLEVVGQEIRYELLPAGLAYLNLRGMRSGSD